MSRSTCIPLINRLASPGWISIDSLNLWNLRTRQLHHHFMDFTSFWTWFAETWSVCIGFIIWESQESRQPRVLIKLREDMFNFLKINKKTSWLTWLHLKLFLQCSSEKLLIKSYLLIVFYFFPHVLVYSHSCQWSVGTVKHVQSVPALTNIPEQS